MGFGISGGNGGNGDDGHDPDVIPLFENLPSDPEFVMFMVQLAMLDGNASGAAQAVGWNPERGRKMCQRHPELRELARRAIGLSQKETIRRWNQMHSAALNTIYSLTTNAIDERVKLAAAQTVIERVEGKVPVRGRQPDTVPEEVTEDIGVRFAAAYHLEKGVSLADALQYAETNPDEVNDWAKRHGLLDASAA